MGPEPLSRGSCVWQTVPPGLQLQPTKGIFKCRATAGSLIVHTRWRTVHHHHALSQQARVAYETTCSLTAVEVLDTGSTLLLLLCGSPLSGSSSLCAGHGKAARSLS